jgi:hypothetical protein
MSSSPPEENGQEAEPSIPPMDAPALEAMQLDREGVERTSGPIRRYAANQLLDPHPSGAGAEVLRDTPFAANTPGFGGETPFFMGAAETGFDFEMDDTDGIPTGLPDLLNLDDASVPPLAPAADAAASAPAPDDVAAAVEARVQEVLQAAVNQAVEQAVLTDRQNAAERERKRRAEARMMAFGIGVFLTSALWGLLLALALYYDALQYGSS